MTKKVPDDIQRRFGAAVRTLRLKNKLTQEQLAFQCGMHWTYLSGIERGVRNPSLKNINAIARTLGVTLSELFSYLPAQTRNGTK